MAGILATDVSTSLSQRRPTVFGCGRCQAPNAVQPSASTFQCFSCGATSTLDAAYNGVLREASISGLSSRKKKSLLGRLSKKVDKALLKMDTALFSSKPLQSCEIAVSSGQPATVEDDQLQTVPRQTDTSVSRMDTQIETAVARAERAEAELATARSNADALVARLSESEALVRALTEQLEQAQSQLERRSDRCAKLERLLGLPREARTEGLAELSREASELHSRSGKLCEQAGGDVAVGSWIQESHRYPVSNWAAGIASGHSEKFVENGNQCATAQQQHEDASSDDDASHSSAYEDDEAEKQYRSQDKNASLNQQSQPSNSCCGPATGMNTNSTCSNGERVPLTALQLRGSSVESYDIGGSVAAGVSDESAFWSNSGVLRTAAETPSDSNTLTAPASLTSMSTQA